MSQKEMRRPPALQRGDTVGLVAPSRKVSREELRPAIELLQQWGLKVKTGEHLFGAENQFSGSDAERAADLQDMFDDPDVRAVICARGGYGALRIVDRIDFMRFVVKPKWFVGYSDATVFHCHINGGFGVQTLHAPMLFSFLKDAESTESLRRTLFGENMDYTWTNDTAEKNRAGAAEAQLVGGNLSLLYALNPSRSDIDTRGKILFLEDLDEQLYHIDRMLLNLKRSWKLNSLAGLVVGGMSEMKDNATPYGKTAEQIIMDAVAEYSFPVAFGFPAGHGTKNMALRLGGLVRLEVGEGKSAELKFL